MSFWRRCSLLLPVAAAGSIALVVALAVRGSKPEVDVGKISIEFDGWRMLSAPGQMVLIVENGTGHPVTVADVVYSGSGTGGVVALRTPPTTTSTRNAWNVYQAVSPIRLSSPEGGPLKSIPPRTKAHVHVDGFPSSGVAEVYFAPWSSKRVQEAAAREARRPKWLQRWLRPAQPTKVAVRIPQARRSHFL